VSQFNRSVVREMSSQRVHLQGATPRGSTTTAGFMGEITGPIGTVCVS